MGSQGALGLVEAALDLVWIQRIVTSDSRWMDGWVDDDRVAHWHFLHAHLKALCASPSHSRGKWLNHACAAQ